MDMNMHVVLPSGFVLGYADVSVLIQLFDDPVTVDVNMVPFKITLLDTVMYDYDDMSLLGGLTDNTTTAAYVTVTMIEDGQKLLNDTIMFDWGEDLTDIKASQKRTWEDAGTKPLWEIGMPYTFETSGGDADGCVCASVSSGARFCNRTSYGRNDQYCISSPL